MPKRKRYAVDIRCCTFQVREADGPHMTNGCVLAEQFKDIARADKEMLFATTLNQKNQVIDKYLISMGTLTASLVHPREVFKPAIQDSAASIAIVHNHPSGNPNPSRQDRELCDRLAGCCKLLGIRLLDFLVIGVEGHTSFVERGWL